MNITEELIDTIEQLIRKGDHQQAKKQLSLFTPSAVPYRLILRASQLLVRAGMAKNSAKLIRPIMFNTNEPVQPTIAAQYALTLQQLGAYTEASKILRGLDFKTIPEANLYYAFTLFSKWDYEDAIPYLERYLEFKQISPYQKIVAKTNLAQAYISSVFYREAEALLDEIENETKKQDYNLLMANGLELRAQLLFAENKFSQALNLLNSAEKMLSTFPTHYQLMVEYWKVICQYAFDPTKTKAIANLQTLRTNSVEKGFWSVVRECDFHRSIIDGDKDLFLKVYFGTPFSKYREKLRKKFPISVELPPFYHWNPTLKKASREKIFKVYEGIDLRSEASLKRGQLSHRLLQALTSDFYVPFRTETLFTYVSPDEHYSPVSSYKKTANAIQRLQNWLKENSIPIKIRFKHDGHRIYFIDPYILEVRIQTDDTFSYDTQSEIEKILVGKNLSSKEISEDLNIPLRTVVRKLKTLIEDGKIAFNQNRYSIMKKK